MMKKYTKNLLTCLLIGATSAAFAFNGFKEDEEGPWAEAPYHKKCPIRLRLPDGTYAKPNEDIAFKEDTDFGEGPQAEAPYRNKAHPRLHAPNIEIALPSLKKRVDDIIDSTKYNPLLREQQLGKILKEIEQYQVQAFECDQYDTWKELLDYANYYYYREVPDEIENIYE